MPLQVSESLWDLSWEQARQVGREGRSGLRQGWDLSPG